MLNLEMAAPTKSLAAQAKAAGIDVDKLLADALDKKDVPLRARIPAILNDRIKRTAGDNFSARVRDLIEKGLAAEEAEAQRGKKASK